MACVHDTALLIASLPGSPIVGMGSPFAFVKPGQEACHLCQGSLYIIDSEYQWHLLRPFLVGRDCPICKNWSTFHVDRDDQGALVIKSLEHGHIDEGDSLAEPLHHVGLL